jgi:hypothetical protein
MRGYAVGKKGVSGECQDLCIIKKEQTKCEATGEGEAKK